MIYYIYQSQGESKMKLPKFIKFLIWKLFVNKLPEKIIIYNYIVNYQDEEDNIDAFLVFIAGQKGHLLKEAVEHTDTSIAELRQGLEQNIKAIYNLADTNYTIITIVRDVDELPDGFMELKKKALEEPNMLDKFKSFLKQIYAGN